MINSVNFMQRFKDEQQNAGHYIQTQRIKVFQTLKQAWQLAKGARLTLIGAFIACIMINVIAAIVLKMIFPQNLPHYGLSILQWLAELGVQIFISYPLIIGSSMLGISRARGSQVSFKELFAYFQQPIFWQITKWMLWLLLIGLSLIILFIAMLLLVVGLDQIMKVISSYLASGAIAHAAAPNSLWTMLVFFAITGLYLWWAYSYSLPLIADKKLQAGFALTVSRKAFNRNVLPIISISLIMLIIVGASLAAGFFLPKPFNLVAISLIFLIMAFIIMPWASVVNGLVFHQMIKSPEANNQ